MPDTAAQLVTRAYVARVDDVIKKDRSLVARLSTAALDRYSTVIEPKGMDLRAYNENKVVLYEHGMDPVRGTMPVGRNGWLKPVIGQDGPELIGKTFFHGKEKKGDDFTERLFEMYRDGDMKGFSVRVMPTVNCSPPTTDEIRARPELANCYMMYRGTELCEYSAVSVPGNAECLTLDEARSVLKITARGLTLPAAVVDRAKALVEASSPPGIGRYIIHDGAKWHLLDDDGRVISEHDTREEAEKARDQQTAEQVEKQAEHGGGGNDDTTKAVALSLPPLPGRSYADSQAELLGQLRTAFDLKALTQAIIDRRDQARGRV